MRCVKAVLSSTGVETLNIKALSPTISAETLLLLLSFNLIEGLKDSIFISGVSLAA